MPTSARSENRWRLPVGLAAVAIGVVIAFVGVFRDSDSGAGSAAASGSTNVLLITLDTTRADRIGCYGHGAAATPTMDALAGSGILFENAFSHVPLTLPSHTSLLTGLYPPTTGVRINGNAGIGSDVPTMATLFKEHGYRTGAFVSSQVLDSAFGLGSGFDLYDDLGDADGDGADHLERRADRVSEAALSWLGTGTGEPFFAWVHFFDPHTPYDPPSDFAARFTDRYDGEIAFVDSQIARIVGWLDEAGLRDETMIVVVGDHGEGLKDHEETEHGFFVYNSTMHVPLIISFPKGLPDPARVESPVGLVDVLPTVAELLGWEAPEGVEGRSLAEACRTGDISMQPVYGECEYPRLSFGWAALRSLTTDRWKYIDAPTPELYDLANDAGELNNVLDKQHEVAGEMRAALADVVSRMDTRKFAAKRVVLDADALARLSALGYVAGAVTPEDLPDDGERRDPKEAHAIFMAFTRALGMVRDEQYDYAASVLEELARQSPESGEIQSVLGSCYLKLERYADAQRAFERCLKTAPPAPRPLCGLGDALQSQNLPAQAVPFYEKALELSPDWEPAHRELGTIYSKLKQFSRAEEHWRRCIELRPGHVHYLTNLGTVLLALRRPDEAIPLLEEALNSEPTNEFAHRSLWQCYRAVGRRGDAIQALRRATETVPALYPLTCPLAWLLATTPGAGADDIKDAIRWSGQCSRQQPENARYLDVLAASYAAGGEFTKAIEAARRASALAGARGQGRLQRQIEERLSLYEAGRPFVEVPPRRDR